MWKQKLDEGKVEGLVVKIDSPPELAGKVRMLSESEQEQLRETAKQIRAYISRVLNTGREN